MYLVAVWYADAEEDGDPCPYLRGDVYGEDEVLALNRCGGFNGHGEYVFVVEDKSRCRLKLKIGIHAAVARVGNPKSDAFFVKFLVEVVVDDGYLDEEVVRVGRNGR